MNKNFKNNLIEKIKKENIKPISRNFFVIKKIFIYLFLGLSIFIWALSVAIVLWYLFEADWFLSHKLWLLKVTMNFLPFFWIWFLTISIVISYFNFKNTDKGYKFYLWQIILWNILISLIIWALFYVSWFSQIIENKIQNNLPKYREYLVWDKIERMKAVWQNEEKGLLLWTILSTEGFNPLKSFKLKDTNSKIWEILVSDKTNIRHDLEIKKLLKIKLIWKKTWDNTFEVDEIRPFIWKWLNHDKK